MKNVFSYMFSSLPKKLIAAALIAMAIIIPVSTISAASVKLEGSIGVANVTAGDTKYSPSVNASYDQVVKFQVYYHNMENPDSGNVANNLRVKITMPTTAGTKQDVRTTISADNASNTVTGTATVNLNRADAMIEYIPGSAVWRHNTGTNDNVNYVETKISDAVVTSGQGLVLENEKPCYNFAATVTVLARVKVPGVKVVKEVRVKGQTGWAQSNTAKPGDTLQYLITYQNTGNTTQSNVVIRDALPAGFKLVPGTTMLYTSEKPNGVKYNSDNIDNGGIVIGTYGPGGGAYVQFEVTTPAESALACGANSFRNIGVAHPANMNEFFNTADTSITRVCNPSEPQYSCDALTVTTGADRKVNATVKYTATNGATYKSSTFDFGDSTTPFVTSGTTASHSYAADGTYTIRVTPSFMVNGKLVTATSAACAKVVTFEKGEIVTPPTTTPSTGPTETIGLFIGASILSAIGYRLWMIRRLGN
ncbi:MAG: PKD domain-containing protein [Candidatus Saccharimonadales bacterium]